MNFPVGTVGKNPRANAGDTGLISGPGRFYILQGWSLVADQTSMASSSQALCSRSSLIVMRVMLSHPFNNFNYLLHAGRRGRDWRPDTPSWVAPGCGCGPAGVLGSGDRLM